MKPKLKVGFQYWCPEIDAASSAFMDALRLKYDVEITWPADVVFFMCYRPSPYTGILGRLLRNRRFMQQGAETPDISWMKGTGQKIYYTPESYEVDMSRCDVGFGHQPESMLNSDHYHRMPFYAMTYWRDRGDLLKPRLERFPWEEWRKREFCEFVYGNPVPEREAFFDLLNTRERVNAPGASRNNCPAIGGHSSPGGHRNSGDCWHGDRLEFAERHKFAISHENAHIPGYVTEKIMTAFLSGCIPIYTGSDYAAIDFNPKAFLHAKDYNSPEELAEAAWSLYQDEEACKEMLAEPIFPNNELPHFMTEEWLLECIEKKILEK